jgi:hypothetical protein
MGDDEPTGDEAKAQSTQTVMPWVWAGLAILLVAGFTAFLVWGVRLVG